MVAAATEATEAPAETVVIIPRQQPVAAKVDPARMTVVLAVGVVVVGTVVTAVAEPEDPVARASVFGATNPLD